jgi:hypothetical protein
MSVGLVGDTERKPTPKPLFCTTANSNTTYNSEDLFNLSPYESPPNPWTLVSINTMGFKVELCTKADMARAFEIISDAFGHDLPYIDAMFPSHPTTEGRVIGTFRLIDMMKNDPCMKFVKVVDTETGAMIAQAKWNIYRDTIPDETDLDGDFWENEEGKRYAQLLHRQWIIPRRKAIRDSGGNLFCKFELS